MTTTQKYWAALAAVALVQIGVLAKIALDRVSLIKHGREIALQVQPVDPRDVLRGDYVILGYDMGRLKHSLFSAPGELGSLKRGAAVYVTLRQAADGAWLPETAGLKYPAAVAPTDVVVKGRLSFAPEFSTPDVPREYGVRYGIESYFVPEGTGKALEQDVRDRKIQALVAVDRDGTLALKGLMIGGERHEDPPLL